MACEDADTILDAIGTVAAGPKQVTVDGQTVEAQSLKELIEAHKYLRSGCATNPQRGIRITRLRSGPDFGE